MRILWVGVLNSDYAVYNRSAANPAATKWTRGLIGGLHDCHCHIHGLTHCYEQVWPRGDLNPKGAVNFDDIIPSEQVSYLNVPYVKNLSLVAAYRRRFRELISTQNIDCVLLYNSMYPFHVAVMSEAKKMGIPSFPIILEDDDPTCDSWRSILKETRFAQGVVFLSKWAYDTYPGKLPVLHLDGGCRKWLGFESIAPKEPFVLYCGSLDHWRGLVFFKRVLDCLRETNIKFIVCGKTKNLESLFSGYKNVDFRGFVSNEELHLLHKQATLFVNTRDPNLGNNKLNFPSKVVNYLSYGKPVVSTWTESFSDDYKKYLVLPADQTPEKFAESVADVFKWSDVEREEYRSAVKDWVCENKLWGKQAERLLSWIKCNV